MSLKSTPRPDRHALGSLFDRVLSAQERRVIQSCAPRFLHLVNDTAEDGAWSKSETVTLRRQGAARDYRVVSYALDPARLDRRLLWIQYAPKPEGAQRNAGRARKQAQPRPQGQQDTQE